MRNRIITHFKFLVDYFESIAITCCTLRDVHDGHRASRYNVLNEVMTPLVVAEPGDGRNQAGQTVLGSAGQTGGLHLAI